MASVIQGCLIFCVDCLDEKYQLLQRAVTYVASCVSRLSTAGTPTLESIVRVDVGCWMTSFGYWFLAAEANGWAEATSQVQQGSSCNSESNGIFDGHVTQDGECSISRSVPGTVAHLFYISQSLYLFMDLSSILPIVVAIWKTSPLLDNNDWTIMSTTELVYTRLRISAADTVEAGPDRTNSCSACSTMLKFVDLRPLVGLK